jgi:hypothetical protein
MCKSCFARGSSHYIRVVAFAPVISLNLITPSRSARDVLAAKLRCPASLADQPRLRVAAFGVYASPCLAAVRPVRPCTGVRSVRRPRAPRPAARRTSLSIRGQAFAPAF